MPIFLSLGSQYSFSDSLAALWPVKRESRIALQHYLAEHFQGQAILTYKAREALELLLGRLQHSDSTHIFFQGFACYALESAITKAGKQPSFVDVAEQSVNLSLETILAAQKRYGTPAALLVQHTFGVPAQMQVIREWCTQNKVALIADVAQSYGAHDETGTELGQGSDAVLCSFGRDKVIDAVSGGAAIIKNTRYFKPFEALDLSVVSTSVRANDAIYPLLTWKIRHLYQLGVGKLLHVVVKKLGLLQSPLYSQVDQPSELPLERAAAALGKIETLPVVVQHRRVIAEIYQTELFRISAITQLLSTKDIRNGANLRFPIWVENPQAVLKQMRQHNIHIADRWYRSVIDCSTLDCQSQYEAGTCPNAEQLAQHAIQLPTHQEITPAAAKQIVAVLKAFYAT